MLVHKIEHFLLEQIMLYFTAYTLIDCFLIISLFPLFYSPTKVSMGECVPGERTWRTWTWSWTLSMGSPSQQFPSSSSWFSMLSLFASCSSPGNTTVAPTSRWTTAVSSSWSLLSSYWSFQPASSFLICLTSLCGVAGSISSAFSVTWPSTTPQAPNICVACSTSLRPFFV